MTSLWIFIGLWLGLYLRHIPALSLVGILSVILWQWRQLGIKLWVWPLLGFTLGAILSLYPNPPKRFDRAIAIVTEVHASSMELWCEGNTYWMYWEGALINPYDVAEISGETTRLRFSSYESRFDYERYLFTKGIEFSLKLNEISWVFRNPIPHQFIKGEITQRIPKAILDQVSGYLFNEIPYESGFRKDLEKTYLLMWVSQSGMLIYGFRLALERILRPFLTDTNLKVASLGALIPLWLVNPTSEVLWRLLSIGLFNLFSTKFRLKQKMDGKGFYSLSLVVSRNIVFKWSIIIYFSIKVFLALMGLTGRGSFQAWRTFFVASLLSVFIALIFAGSQGSLSLNALVYSIVFFPYSVFLFFLSYIGLVFTPLFSLLIPLFRPMPVFAELVANHSFVFYLSDPSSQWPVLFIAFFMVALLIHLRRTFASLNMLSLLIALTTLFSLPWKVAFLDGVFFINVGQGDSTLILSQRRSCLIDTGGQLSFDIATETLIPFFNKLGLNRLDYIVLTHQDFDHDGALPSLMSHFPFGVVIRDADAFPLQVGNVTLVQRNPMTHLTVEENDRSLVLDFFQNQRHYLLMGDASTAVEDALLELDVVERVDILKIGHHGSNTSSSWNFLTSIDPNVAIISTGASNRYGHPNQEVLSRLESLGVTVRRTDLEGTIQYAYFRSL